MSLFVVRRGGSLPLLVACCVLFADCCCVCLCLLLLARCCLLSVLFAVAVCSLLFVVWNVLLVVDDVAAVLCCLLCGVFCLSLFDDSCSLFVVCCVLLFVAVAVV